MSGQERGGSMAGGRDQTAPELRRRVDQVERVERAGPGSVGSPAQARIRRRRLDRLRHVYRDRRERLRADARKERIYRTIIGVLGTVVVVLGLALVPLPGPGWLIVFLGLALLGTEFHWAKRLHAFGRRHLHNWSLWLQRQSWAVRIGLGTVSALCVGALVYGYLVWMGIPGWTPDVVGAELRRVPGL